MSKNQHIDLESARYSRDFPEFCGVQKLVELLEGKKSIRGSYLETLLGEFEKYIPDHWDEVLAAYQATGSKNTRLQLLMSIAEAKVPESEPFLIELLTSNDESFRSWAVIGLKNLDTKTARRALWIARSYTLATSEETEAFRRTIHYHMPEWEKFPPPDYIPSQDED